MLEFESVAGAEKVYAECDGMEFESSSAKIDLRFIPDHMTFEEGEARERCTAVPSGDKYRPKFFTTTALQQVKVQCTWDETDPTRRDTLGRIHDPKDHVDEEDLKAYLASSSEEDEEEGEGDGEKAGGGTEGMADPIHKYRALLHDIQAKEEGKRKGEVELEVTWGVGLKQKAEEIVKKKSKEAELEGLTPWEQRLHKSKEKRRGAKKGRDEEADEGAEQPFSDDDVEVDMNDPFFKDELIDRAKKDGPPNKQKPNKKKNESQDDKGETQVRE